MTNPLARTDEVMTLDCQRVMHVLPHRYPFLLVDPSEGSPALHADLLLVAQPDRAAVLQDRA
jgi:hypothetical protein